VCFVAEFVTLDDFARPIDSAYSVPRHAENLCRFSRAHALAIRDFHVTPQCLRVVSIIRCAAASIKASSAKVNGSTAVIEVLIALCFRAVRFLRLRLPRPH
jgi:hypothetical protein